MANSNTELPNTEDPMDLPDDKEKGSGSGFSAQNAGQETPPESPSGVTGSASESQAGASDASSEIPLEPSETQASQVASEEPAVNDSTRSLVEAPQSSTPPGIGEEITSEAAAQSTAEPDVIDEIRRSLKETENEQPKNRPGLIPGVVDWWRRTFAKTGGRSADDAGIEARLGDASISLYTKPASDQSGIGEFQVGDLFGELEQLARTDGELPKVDVSVGATAGIERAAEPASKLKESETQARPVEATHDTVRISYELTKESQGGHEPYTSYDNIREAALEGFEEAPPQADSGSGLSLRELVSRTLRELKPSHKRLLAGGCIVILLVALILGGYLIAISRSAKVAPAAAVVLGPSYPVEMSFPGGWNFPLAVGKLQDNKWTPRDAEWLEGTEISRWVSLPWSSQLEAVFRTLKPGDVLELVMSNSDHLDYKVQSVQQRNVDQMAGVAKTLPSLVVFLTNNGSKETWVITAIP